MPKIKKITKMPETENVVELQAPVTPPEIAVTPSNTPKQHPQQCVDLSSLIKTGEENKNSKPIVAAQPIAEQRHVITERQYKEPSFDKWEKTSVCQLPEDIQIINLFHYNEKSGNTQVFIVLQRGNVAGVSSIRLEV